MPRRSRTFRIFVSSTFSDLVAERNALQEDVWPKLRDLCMSHGCRFQAIDLRWGVSEEAALDQQTMNICLREIRRCREVTPRPNFVVLLGERYGWRPIPPQIEAGQFDRLATVMSREDAARLRGWYRLDGNAVPPEYVLKPREPGGPFEDPEAWNAEERELHRILLDAAREAGLPGDARIKYERSATEQEIREGALTARTDHAFCYFRTIEGLPEGEAAGKFGEPDPEARRLHERLKDELRAHFPADQVHELTARWEGDTPTDDHLNALCARVEADLSAAILEEIGALESQDALEGEIEAHEAFGAERARHFIGREDILARIRAYIEHGPGHPLVIYGAGGSGKSALMARATSDCGSRIAERDSEDVLIHRFIGATPDSTDVRSLLESLCRQIGREYGLDDEPPTEYRELVEEFPKRLGLATAEKRLALFLDALDQLSPTDNAHTLNWLPREFPDSVRSITTVLDREDEEAGTCLRSARMRFREECLLRLEPLTARDGEAILGAWLAEAGCTLTAQQRDDVLGKFEREGLPLYLKVAFEEARRWHSYDGLPCGADEVPGLFGTVEGVIRDMLSRLEDPRNHGRVLVSKALGYLAAARHGLTEDELIEVLSEDEEVKDDFRSRSRYWPEAERLPVVLWSRLYFDLAPYLTERSADQASLLGFYHRQLREAAAAEYLDDPQECLAAHRGLAEYFHEDADPDGSGSWMGHNPRAFTELLYHQRCGRMDDALGDTMLDMDFAFRGVRTAGFADMGGEYSDCAESVRGPRRALSDLIVHGLRWCEAQWAFDLCANVGLYRMAYEPSLKHPLFIRKELEAAPESMWFRLEEVISWGCCEEIQPRCVAIAPGLDKIAVGTLEATYILSPAAKEIRVLPVPAEHIAFSRSGRLAAALTHGTGQVSVIDAATGRILGQTRIDFSCAAAFDPHEKTLVVTGRDLVLFDWRTGQRRTLESYGRMFMMYVGFVDEDTIASAGYADYVELRGLRHRNPLKLALPAALKGGDEYVSGLFPVSCGVLVAVEHSHGSAVYETDMIDVDMRLDRVAEVPRSDPEAYTSIRCSDSMVGRTMRCGAVASLLQGRDSSTSREPMFVWPGHPQAMTLLCGSERLAVVTFVGSRVELLQFAPCRGFNAHARRAKNVTKSSGESGPFPVFVPGVMRESVAVGWYWPFDVAVEAVTREGPQYALLYEADLHGDTFEARWLLPNPEGRGVIRVVYRSPGGPWREWATLRLQAEEIEHPSPLNVSLGVSDSGSMGLRIMTAGGQRFHGLPPVGDQGRMRSEARSIPWPPEIVA